MDGYTFDEGIAFLVLVRAPRGVINHLNATHNRNQLHSEIHKQLRIPRTMRLLKDAGYSRETEQSVSDIVPESNEIEPKPDEIETKSDEIKPKPGETDTESHEMSDSDDDETDPNDIILTIEDVRKHENTRLEDMPNDLCRNLWLKRQEVYREMQQAHLKMRSVPEGEEHNEERAKWRAEVLRLNAENESYWKQIDEEVERFRTEQSQSPEDQKQQTPSFYVSTYRAYISKALRKKQLKPAQLSELQHRVDAMLAAKVELKPETLKKLKAIGITVG